MTFFGRGRDGSRGGLVVLGTAIATLATVGTAHAAITVSSPSVTEGNAGQANLTFTVTESVGLGLFCGGDVTVSTVAKTATSGVDYVPLTGATVAIPSGVLSCEATVDVKVNGDLLDEPDETLELRVTSEQDQPAGTGTITDDDVAPTASIGAGARAEGTGGSGYVGLPVALSSPSGRVITVPYTVTAGSASAPQDISAAGGTLTIPAGAGGGEIRVATVTDNIDELDETFTVTIGTPTNATRGTATATGTVLNDDVPAISIANVAAGEGTSATPTAFQFPVTLSNPSTRTITVTVKTADIQATAPADYAAVDRTVTFEPGDTGEVVTVDVVADAVDEAGEAFAVNLSDPSGATLGTAAALGGILDDDGTTTTSPGGTTTGGTTTGGTTTVPGGTVTPKPGTTPATTTPPGTTSSDRSAPRVALTGLAVRRPRSIRIKVACPATETRCTGTVTIFSVAQRRSKLKVLRRETRIARGRFTLAGGASRTLTMIATGDGIRVLRATRRIKVRAYGVATDAAGNTGTGTLSGTLRR